MSLLLSLLSSGLTFSQISAVLVYEFTTVDLPVPNFCFTFRPLSFPYGTQLQPSADSESEVLRTNELYLFLINTSIIWLLALVVHHKSNLENLEIVVAVVVVASEIMDVLQTSLLHQRNKLHLKLLKKQKVFPNCSQSTETLFIQCESKWSKTHFQSSIFCNLSWQASILNLNLLSKIRMKPKMSKTGIPKIPFCLDINQSHQHLLHQAVPLHHHHLPLPLSCVLHPSKKH